MRFNYRNLFCFLSVCAMLTSFSDTSFAQGAVERLNTLKVGVGNLEKQLTTMEKYYINPELARTAYKFESQFNEGRVFFLLGDYARASIFFVEIVENSANKNHPGYIEALYYLAESLYQGRNVLAAKHYFEELLKSGGRKYFQESIIRMAELALRQEKYKQVVKLYKRLKKEIGVEQIDPHIYYLYAKSLYFTKKHKEVIQFLERIPSDHYDYLRSLYLKGAIFAFFGKLDDALVVYKKISSVDIESLPADQREIVELSFMALARLYYEREDFDNAIENYHHVSRTSINFDQALYEITWTLIRKGEFRESLRHIEVLLLNNPNSVFFPEGQLMRGNIYLNLKGYSEAILSYHEVLSNFQDISDNMKSILKSEKDPELFFRNLIRKDFETGTVEYLPDFIPKWVEPDPNMNRSLLIVEDLVTSQKDIIESYIIIEDVENAINARSRIDVFPVLKEGWARGLEVEAEAIDVKRQLIEIERKLVWSIATPEERRIYDEMRSSSDRLEQQYNAIPKTEYDLARREERVEDRIHGMEVLAFKLSYQIEAINAQLVAIEKWLSDAIRNDEVSDEEIASIRKGLAREKEEVIFLENEFQEIKRQLSREKAEVGIRDESAAEEERIKKEYQLLLAKEKEFLGKLRSRLSPEQQKNLVTIDKLRERLLYLEGGLRGFFSRLNEIVEVKVSEIHILLEQEKASLARFHDSVISYTSEAENIVGKVAYANFRMVEKQFSDIVLRADVGLIDISWQRKEEKSKRIEELIDVRVDEIDTLDEDFAELRE